MQVEVQFGAQIAAAAGTDAESVELPEGAALSVLIKTLSDRHGGEFSRVHNFSLASLADVVHLCLRPQHAIFGLCGGGPQLG